MSFFNSPSSFGDGELLFKNVSEECMDTHKCLQHFRNKLEESLVSKKEFYKSLLNETLPRLQETEDQIIMISTQVEQLKDTKNSLTANLLKTKQSLSEIELKKKVLEKTENEDDIISQDELSEMLQKVVSMESENELKIKEMKKTAKALVGQMCFYKEYLDVYVDIPGDEDYVLYFRKCQGNDVKRPKEWIRIRTDNFKEYFFADSSLPVGSNEQQELLNRYNNGIHLRELVLLARKYNLSK